MRRTKPPRSHADAFATLDPTRPLLLLPVRLETRIALTGLSPALRVRVFPDRVHVDAHVRALTDDERRRGEAFWSGIWGATERAAAGAAAFRALADALGTSRAAWVVRARRPASATKFWLGLAVPATPDFPAPASEESDRVPRARLLPARWLVRARRGGWSLDGWGAAVPADLPVGPDPDADSPAWPAWMTDYAEAERVGMAVTLPIPAYAIDTVRTGLDDVIAIGVARGLADEGLARLLEAHHYGDGLALHAGGTPTNNTEETASAWSRAEGAGERLLRESLPAAGGTGSAAGRLARALGLPADTALGHAAGAWDPAEEEARALVRLLWPVSAGTLLERMASGETTPAASPAGARWARDWAAAHLRPGGPYATLRVGHTPLAVLPALHEPARAGPPTTGDTATRGDGWIAWLVSHLAPTWDAAAARAPTMVGATDPDDAFLRILATQPHAATVAPRTLQETRDQVLWVGPIPIPWGIQSSWEGYLIALRTCYQEDADLLGRVRALGWQDTLAEQREHVATLAASNASARRSATGERAARLDEAAVILDYAARLLELHEARLAPLSAAGVPGLQTAIHRDGPRIAFALYDDDGAGWAHDRPWVQAPGAEGEATAQGYLTWLAERATEGGIASLAGAAPAALASPRPVLFCLAREAVLRTADAPSVAGDAAARAADLASIRAALTRLAASAPDRLEQRLRETLGAFSSRLDAWHSARAEARVAALRAAAPTGIQVGGYGRVEGLLPRDGEAGGGFVAAPSMAQAATAAVLRAGYDGHTGADREAFAVDLSSARVRAAVETLDAVRAGFTLEEVLGAGVERALAAAGRGDVIDDLRRAAPGRDAADVADGVALAKAWAAGSLDTGLLDSGGAPLRKALAAAVDTLDATADALLAEGVHQVVQGNPARAAAALSALSDGAAPPPELELPATRPTGVSVTHRLLLLDAPSTAWPAPNASLLARACPALDRFAGAVLGSPAGIGFAVGGVARTLADVGLAALELVMLAPAEEGAATPELEAILRGDATGELDPDAGGEGIALADALLVASALRRLFGAARPADARDLGEADAGVAGALRDRRAGELSARVDDALAALDTALAEGRGARARCRPFWGMVRGATDPATLAASARARRDAGTLVELPAPVPFRLAAPDVAEEARQAREKRADRGMEGAWLDQVARVRAGAHRLHDLVRLADALGTGPALGHLQLPGGDRARWAALARPKVPTTSIVVASAGPCPLDGAIEGLWIDDWVERVPNPRQTAGLALSYPTPSAQAPQVALLVVPPDGAAYDLALVESTVRDTFTWARRRSAAPEDLAGLGHLLPAVFLEG
ncbi:MAG: hypothetical protein ACOZNI_29605 [Myxococcota bacterium]